MIILLTYIFFLNGALYYFFPSQHYLMGGVGGWIQYIKYLVFIPIILISCASLPNLKKYLSWYLVLFMFLIVTNLIGMVWVSEQNLLLFQLFFPFLTFIVAGGENNFKITLKDFCFFYWVLILSTLLFSFFEVYYNTFGDIYSRSGFRATGPFMNPNNTGLVASLLSIIFYIIEPKKTHRIVSLLLCIFVILLSGSKTALLVYIIGLFFSVSAIHRVAIFITCAILGMAFVFYQQVISLNTSIREFTLESAYIRYQTITDLFTTYGQDLKGILFGVYNTSLVDNAYLDILLFSGILMLVFFIFVQFIAVVKCIKAKNKVLLICHLMLFLMMLTTNIPRLWPLGYIYWLVVGLSFLLKTSPRKSNLIFS